MIAILISSTLPNGARKKKKKKKHVSMLVISFAPGFEEAAAAVASLSLVVELLVLSGKYINK